MFVVQSLRAGWTWNTIQAIYLFGYHARKAAVGSLETRLMIRDPYPCLGQNSISTRQQ